MIDFVIRTVIGVLIVLPVVAILALGLKRLVGPSWDPLAVAAVALVVTLVLVLAYLLLA